METRKKKAEVDNMELLKKTLQSISGKDEIAVIKARERVDSLAKPLGSLGKLEDIAIKIAGMTGKLYNTMDKRNVIIMCADNGIVEEGVSCTPQTVTGIMTAIFLKYITGVGVLAKEAGAELTVVDIGVNGNVDAPGVLDRKVDMGTANILRGPAMTREQAIKAIETGISVVDEVVDKGCSLLGTGEMGIGNTSTSTLVLCALSGLSVDEAAGKGAGLTEEQFINKKNVLKKALEVNNPDRNDPIDVLAKVGGFDIAGLVGCYLGAAYRRVPIVIDGLISSAAALIAYRLNDKTRDYMIASHMSEEPGAKFIMKELELSPMLNMNMRLGEGSGCPLAFHIIDAAEAMIRDMGTFGDIMLNNDFLVDIR